MPPALDPLDLLGLGRIAVDEAMAVRDGGSPDRLTRLVIGGWAVGPDAIERISLFHRDEFVGLGAIGLARPDVAQLFPDNNYAAYSGFSIALQDLTITDLDLGELTIEAEIAGAEPIRTRIAVTERADRKATGPAPIRITVERAAISPQGLLTIDGWAVSINALVAVQVWINGRRIGAAQTGKPRADVGEQFRDYHDAGHSGFHYTGRIPESEAAELGSVKIEAIAIGGIARSVVAHVQQSQATAPAIELTPELIRFEPDDFRLTLDGIVTVGGWALADSGIAWIRVALDGAPIGEFNPSVQRDDVAALFPHIPDARYPGFNVEIATGTDQEGEHSLSFSLETVSGHRRDYSYLVRAGGYGLSGAAPVEASVGEVLMNIDYPMLTNGEMREPITDVLELSGWALAPSGVDKIILLCDGEPAGSPYYGQRRLDIESTFPDIENAQFSGFGLSLPASMFADGSHEFSIVVTAKSGATHAMSYRATVEKSEVETGARVLRRKMPYLEAQSARAVLARSRYEPEFVFLLDADIEGDLGDAIATTVASFRRQLWPRWQLVVRSANRRTASWIAHLLADEYADLGNRLRLLDELALPSFASTRGPSTRQRASDLAGELLLALPETAGDRLVGLLVAGDEIGVDSLIELALANAVGTRAELLYADDRRIEPSAGLRQAFFKPDWSPDLMLSTNYLGRAWVADPALIRRVAEHEIRASGEYDLALRLTEDAQGIRHVAKVLFDGEAEETPAAMRAALETALDRRGIEGSVETGCLPRTFRIRREVTVPGRVSIIIPSIAAHGHIINCLASIRALSTYPDIEIVIVDNIRGEGLSDKQAEWKQWFQDNADVVVIADVPFNWSLLNNMGADAASGAYLLFLNDDVEVLDPHWLETLVADAARPEVGLVGPQLLYPDRKVQHAGLFLCGPGQARHAFRFAAEDEPGYFGLALTQRNMIAVTGACMMMRRHAFEACGRFEEAHSVVNNDLDFCLRAGSKGMLVVYTPHTRLIHHELASRAKLKDVFDTAVFLAQWREIFATGDPFYNPNLATTQDNYNAEAEPLRTVFAGNPIASKRDIKRILAVKLDHIGDLITAFPAFERIKEKFPAAKLSLLVAKSSRAMAGFVPDVEHVFDFQFFNAKSGLGNVEVSDEDYAALCDELAPYQFDLAIDLRKHGDTRKVLNHTGARYLAGCDNEHKGGFPWLDITMSAQSDMPYVNAKWQHVADDMINLVDVVANAFDEDSEPVTHAHEELPVLSRDLIDRFPNLFASPYICIHPAAGNELRQWSPDQFATLADMLIDAENLPVVILGGPDEAEIAGKVIEGVRNRHMLVSLVGATKLSDVPAVIANAVLFVGNNSGPSHIAGWLGTPTVSVHSAVVESEEWAPRGRNALAIRRDTVCSPCYRATLDQCHRNLACLATLPVGVVLEACRRLIRIRKPAWVAKPAPRDAMESAPPTPAKAAKRRAR